MTVEQTAIPADTDERPALTAGALFLFTAACQEKSAFTPPPPPHVTVSLPLRQDVTVYLERTGNTQAINTVELDARVEGYLDKVFFKDGEMVKKGQPLFLIQQDTYQARLQQAEGNVLNQRALLDHAKTEFERYSGLYRKKAAPETEVDNWRYQRDSAEAGLLIARAQRDLARLDLGYTRITAPFDGRMDRRLVDPGNLVGSGQNTVLSVITQMDPLYIYFNVSERDIAPLVGNSKKIASAAKRPNSPFSSVSPMKKDILTRATWTLPPPMLPNPPVRCWCAESFPIPTEECGRDSLPG